MARNPRRAQQARAGDLIETVVFEVEASVADGYGGQTLTWVTHASVFAAVDPLIVAERDQHGAQRNVTQYRFTVYRDPSITEQMRIVWDGRRHNILGIRRGSSRDILMDIIAEHGAELG